MNMLCAQHAISTLLDKKCVENRNSRHLKSVSNCESTSSPGKTGITRNITFTVQVCGSFSKRAYSDGTSGWPVRWYQYMSIGGRLQYGANQTVESGPFEEGYALLDFLGRPYVIYTPELHVSGLHEFQLISLLRGWLNKSGLLKESQALCLVL